MNAREFYYANVAPGDRGKNYTVAHGLSLIRVAEETVRANLKAYRPYAEGSQQLQDWLDELEKAGGKVGGSEARIMAHEPNLSNDLALEHWMQLLQHNAAPAIAERIGEMFVAKVADLALEAFARNSVGKYTGDLVCFHVGLSDASYQYAIAYTEQIELTRLRHEMGDDDPRVQTTFENLTLHLGKLAVAQKKWRLEGGIVRLVEDLCLYSEFEPLAIEVAIATDLFILAHEISHHLLGHTGRKNVGGRFLESLPPQHQIWRRASGDHRGELEADALAVLLVAGSTDDRTGWKRVTEAPSDVRAILGPLLTLTILGQVSSDPWRPSLTHPSEAMRFEQCRVILDLLVQEDHLFESVEEDIMRFQVLLFATQERGLGEQAFRKIDGAPDELPTPSVGQLKEWGVRPWR